METLLEVIKAEGRTSVMRRLTAYTVIRHVYNRTWVVLFEENLRLKCMTEPGWLEG